MPYSLKNKVMSVLDIPDLSLAESELAWQKYLINRDFYGSNFVISNFTRIIPLINSVFINPNFVTELGMLRRHVFEKLLDAVRLLFDAVTALVSRCSDG